MAGNGRKDQGTRNRRGQYVRTADNAESDAHAAGLRSRGLTYRQIAAEMGFTSSASAYDAVQRALAAIVAEPAADVRKLELDRLDAMWQKAVEVMQREHVVTSNTGKIVYDVVEYATDDEGNVKFDEHGRPLAKTVVRLRDDAPTLAAIKTLLSIQERRAKLLGLDSPVKAEVAGKLTYEVVGVDVGTPPLNAAAP